MNTYALPGNYQVHVVEISDVSYLNGRSHETLCGGRLYSFVLVTVWWALRPPILQAWEQLKRAIAFVECRRRVVECRLLYPPLYLSLKIALHSITKSRIHRSSLMAITLIFGHSARELYFQRWDVTLT